MLFRSCTRSGAVPIRVQGHARYAAVRKTLVNRRPIFDVCLRRHVWRISTFLVGLPLLWAASVVADALLFEYTDTSSGAPVIPQPDFFASHMDLDASGINGLFNLRFFVTMILLLALISGQFALVAYTFLNYSLTPFLPVRGNQILAWAKYEGLKLAKDGSSKQS